MEDLSETVGMGASEAVGVERAEGKSGFADEVSSMDLEVKGCGEACGRNVE